MARTRLPVVPVSKIFEDTVAKVKEMEGRGFRGVVDVGVTLQNLTVQGSGWIGVIIGGEDKKTSTTVQLATRLHLGDEIQDRPEQP